jgi:hypothetical protein
MQVSKIDRNRFISHINQMPHGCWIWKGSPDRCGYGQMRLNGKRPMAHNISWWMFVGEIPKDKEIDHICEVRLCVNPTHLQALTHKENVNKGKGLGAVNTRKTHCKQGHPLSGDNLRYDKGRYGMRRNCKTCQKKWHAEYYKRTKANNRDNDHA